ELVFDHLPHFATPFADEGEDHDVSGGASGHHAHQSRLPHARPADETDALAFSDRAQQIDQADTDGEDLVDALPAQGCRHFAFHTDDLAGGSRAAVERVPERVDDPSDQALPHDRPPSSGTPLDPVATTDSLGAAEDHRSGGVPGNGDDLSGAASV